MPGLPGLPVISLPALPHLLHREVGLQSWWECLPNQGHDKRFLSTLGGAQRLEPRLQLRVLSWIHESWHKVAIASKGEGMYPPGELVGAAGCGDWPL